MRITQVDPLKGNVAFAAALYGWSFTLESFATLYCEVRCDLTQLAHSQIEVPSCSPDCARCCSPFFHLLPTAAHRNRPLPRSANLMFRSLLPPNQAPCCLFPVVPG